MAPASHVASQIKTARLTTPSSQGYFGYSLFVMQNRLTLRELEILDTLLTERSLTRAALALRLSQPAVSKVLARLRRRFADPLLVRAAHGMEATRRARSLQRAVRQVLMAARELDAVAEFDPQRSERLFRLFISDVGVVRLLPQVMRTLQTEGCRVLLHAVQIDPQRLLAKLEGGDIDLAVGPFPALGQTIRRQRLYTEGYIGVTRLGHPRLGAHPSLSEFREERHVIVSSYATPDVHEPLDRQLTAALPPHNIALRVPSFVAAALVAKHSDAIATMPERAGAMLAQELGLQLVRPPLALPRIVIGLCWHEGSHRDPANVWLRSLFHRLFSDSSERRIRPQPTSSRASVSG
jgi:DNA-binding transcriptional LysR family regulator